MRSISKFFAGPSARAWLLALAALAVIAPLSLLPLGQNLENQALDLCYRLRHTAAPPPELLIVGIDEASFHELRRPWPWPRSLHADLIKRLAQAGAGLIVFDVLFAEPTTPEDDSALAAAMQEAGNVILAQAIETVEDPRSSRQILVEPLEIFSRSAFSPALFMVTPDADGVVRRFRPHLGGLETMPAQVFHSVRPQKSMQEDFTGLIHYVGPPGSIETVSYTTINFWTPPGLSRTKGFATASSSSAGCWAPPLTSGSKPTFFPPRFMPAPGSPCRASNCRATSWPPSCGATGGWKFPGRGFWPFTLPWFWR
ncbi:MAG: CHASE2 domain-containing protein [Deltaproteobacteria bacterium]|nr:CHASE2 domain-containing protein [Deltaproteobacteria bacterium]